MGRSNSELVGVYKWLLKQMKNPIIYSPTEFKEYQEFFNLPIR